MNRLNIAWKTALGSTLAFVVVELIFATLFTDSVLPWTPADTQLTTPPSPVMTAYGCADKVCAELPTTLVGRIKVNSAINKTLTWRTLEDELSYVQHGGEWCPQDSPALCLPRHKVAIIVPYKNREDQLLVFLHHIHPFLQRQQIHYGIYVVEQANTTKEFNKGRLMNAGFVEAMRQHNWTCVIVHDVDLLPENDLNTYRCDLHNVRHMTVAVDRYQYKYVGPNVASIWK
ncbi:PREDICTED: beta-1,4-galactosyltransferase 3-like [Priapulus caudatus]|uniref:Beta-1,4-galactosyltransferase 3-like n=1 Tax=Priapulus caudatus TaxID=37621 RepID=A0ABM1EJ59_PRICU|nr:PREDICTED: beta-1,4-galactosyltransferase 3-like [Priapulus caudatus]